jgi:hypothetical protein
MYIGYVSKPVFESNVTGALLYVYPSDGNFLVADEAFAGSGDCAINEEIPNENFPDYGIIGKFFSKRRAIDAARFGM